MESELSELLTAREISSLFWLTVFCFWVIWKDKSGGLKAAFRNFLFCFLNPWIISTFLLVIFWIIGIVLILSKLGFWSLENLKLTLYWAIGVAVVSLFESKAAKKRFSGFSMAGHYLGAIAFVQIFVSIRSLPLAAEFVLVPISSMLIMVAAYSDNKTEYKPAKKAAEGGLIIVGLVLFSWSLLALYSDPKDYLFDFSTNILLPTILTLGFLPFIICFYLFLGYEYAIRVITGIEGLRRMEKLRLSLLAFRCAGFNLERISLLERHMRLHRPKSRSDLVEVIDNLSYTFNIRSSSVSEQSLESGLMGWSVPDSQSWLSQYNLVPKFYEWLGHAWQDCDSIEACTQDSKTTLSYYIAGNSQRAEELELLLEVFGDQVDSYLSGQFSDAAGKLVEMTCGMKLDSSTKARLANREPFSIERDGCLIEFSHTEFSSPSGVEVKLLIKARSEPAESMGIMA